MRKWPKVEIYGFFLVILLAALIRFFRIDIQSFFTYDQARDYLIIKKMIIDHKFTLVGPTVLAPGVFLPPFYYYSLIPFLQLSNFHLWGPDIYTAIFGIGAVAIFYFLVRDLFSSKIAFFSSLLFGLNPYLVEASRHAWNPNTIYFFSLLFALAFERYIIRKKSGYLILAAFAFSWSLNLHYSIFAFFPFLLFLVYKEIRRRGISHQLILSASVFFFLVSPLLLFEVRHHWSNTAGLINFLAKQNNSSFLQALEERLVGLGTDLIKMPLVLISGLNQAQNLTINPSQILLWDKVNIFSALTPFLALRLLCSFILIIASVLASFRLLKSKNRQPIVFVLIFLALGFIVRLFFPPTSFYFYHYTFLFPFVFLLISVLIYQFFKNPISLFGISVSFLIIFVSGSSLSDWRFPKEVKGENYFLPASSIIAQDYSSQKKNISIVANLADTSRWDHNALEYRYFLETSFRLPLGGWEATDYQNSDILYLVDETNLTDPLKLGGLEMTTFRPRRISREWQTDNGFTVYRLERQ